MVNASKLDRIAERARHMSLTRNLIKCSWAPLSGDGLIRHGYPVTENLTPGDGRAPPHLGGTDTVATFRSWRGSRTPDHEDPTTTKGRAHWRTMAERVGFEPTVGCPTLAFQASTFVHSVISPKQRGLRGQQRGGGGGIRTRGRLPYNGFRIHRLRPLGHPSIHNSLLGPHLPKERSKQL